MVQERACAWGQAKDDALTSSNFMIVVMGVSGSAKSLIGTLLSARLAVPFCEGDDLHPAANIAKMQAGDPLDDADRAPWLARVAGWIGDHPGGGVVSCSALRRRYRERLRQDQVVIPSFVLLNPPRAVLQRRLADRRGHFMPATLLDSQLATLELPSPDEAALSITRDDPPQLLIDEIVAWLSMVTVEPRSALVHPPAR